MAITSPEFISPRFCKGYGGFFICGGTVLTPETASVTGIEEGHCRACTNAYSRKWKSERRPKIGSKCNGLGKFWICGGIELTPLVASPWELKGGFCSQCACAYYNDLYSKKKERKRELRRQHAPIVNARQRRDSHIDRERALSIIGGAILACVCCNETISAFLTIGHKLDGSEPKLHSHALYLWVIRNPELAKELLQIECIKCNMGRMCGNICPHKFKLGETSPLGKTDAHIHDGCEANPHCLGIKGIPICGGVLLTETNWYKTDKLRGRKKCKRCCSEHARLINEVTKIYCLDALGGKCACCGESCMVFLQRSHPNDDGKDDRETYGSLFGRLYGNGDGPNKEIIVECANCNFARLMNNGICPHKQIQATS